MLFASSERQQPRAHCTNARPFFKNITDCIDFDWARDPQLYHLGWDIIPNVCFFARCVLRSPGGTYHRGFHFKDKSISLSGSITGAGNSGGPLHTGDDNNAFEA